MVLGGGAVSYERGTPVSGVDPKIVCERFEQASPQPLMGLPCQSGHFPPRLTYLPGQWLQCQANGSNVCRVLRSALDRVALPVEGWRHLV